MALKDQISELVTPAVSDLGFYLEDVHVATPGNHRIVTCIVDGDLSLNLDQVTSVSRVISELLDEAAFMGETPFTLEVTSPGVDRPLTERRHWEKNVTRIISMVMNDGTALTGRLTELRADDATFVENIQSDKAKSPDKQITLLDINFDELIKDEKLFSQLVSMPPEKSKKFNQLIKEFPSSPFMKIEQKNPVEVEFQ